MLIQEWFAQSFLDRVHAEFMQAALAFGQITLPNGSTLPLAKLDKFTPHTWQGRRWEWVDPLKDIEADIAAINAGLKSPQSVAAKLGLDYEDLLIEIKAAETMRSTLGIKLASEAAAAASAAGQAAAEAAATAKTDQSNKELAQQFTELRSLVAAMASRGPAPAPQMNVDLRTGDIERSVKSAIDTMASAHAEHIKSIKSEMPINITMPEIPATVVNVTVEPTPVTMEATIQPAPVVVNNAFATKAIQTVERNADDEITRTVTTYEGGA
jgi:hypothetical protein